MRVSCLTGINWNNPYKMGSVLLVDFDVDDLTSVSLIDEEAIVSILRYRYRKHKTVTLIGEIFLSLNPFGGRRQSFSGTVRKKACIRPSSQGPSIATLSQRIYRKLTKSTVEPLSRAQCCVFSGDSGSGKTEASKTFLRELLAKCPGRGDLEAKIIAFNPLLEAFGNAKTSLNNNSSRFGKHIRLNFDSSGKVLGATLSGYLLEKCRLTRQNPGESNFHIFHLLFSSLSDQKLQKLKLDRFTRYRYLPGLGRKTAVGPLTSQPSCAANGMLAEMVCAAGFSKREQKFMTVVLAAVLSIGNIRFGEDPGGSTPFVAQTEVYLRNVSELLELDASNFRNQLQNLEIYSRGEIISRPYTKAEAEDCRDSIARALYSRLFSWIIHRINQDLTCGLPSRTEDQHNVGILDIFGFENLTCNSFEQLLINLTNEQLHQLFNFKIFKQEQQDYEDEGLDRNLIAYNDNANILKLFLDRPIGLLSLIDEESHFPRGSDRTLAEKFEHHFRRNPLFQCSIQPIANASSTYSLDEKLSTSFSIRHFAGEVVYEIEGFLEKNRDSLPGTFIKGGGTQTETKMTFVADRIALVFQTSRNPLVSLLFQAIISRTGSFMFDDKEATPGASRTSGHPGRSTRKRLTLGYQFRGSLLALIDQLKASDTSFVRCIRPNKEQKPGKFDDAYVLTQLRNSGVLETVWLRRQGFPYRPSFNEFGSRFRGLLNEPHDDLLTLIDSSLLHYGNSSWHLGKTRVCIKYEVAEDLARRIALRDKAARTIQRVFRKYRRCLQMMRKQERVKQPEVTACPPLYATSLHIARGVYTGQDTPETHPDDSAYSPSEHEYAYADADQVCQWFKDCVYDQLGPQKNRRVVQITRKNVPTWWFDHLTRQEAEDLLRAKSAGTFLVRGTKDTPSVLVLSFRATPSSKCCRHYLIDLADEKTFAVRGEKITHPSLPDLLNYYRQNPLSNYDGYLTIPYGQEIPIQVRHDSNSRSSRAPSEQSSAR
ncbi:hypothetical protein RvY_13683-2 [Ramazzottius varieornatus]|uniref:Myosin motor domain-containing protein n=1 Tax=Ramazzottius varieornatus TaxID=947166 RepID=A0A1D1VNS6_RAMVA|nr:hypothetical protein RvY_13683-2 [Ramazzottius varieornatus]